MDKYIVKNKSNNLSGKYSQNLLAHAKQSSTDAVKTALKREIQKPAETTDDLIGNKTSGKITKILISSPQNSSTTVESEIETPEERYTSPKMI